MQRLVQGLTRYDGGLLHETLLARSPIHPGSGDGKARLSWHGWDAKTSLLLNLNNLLSAFLGADSISPPGSTETEPDTADDTNADSAGVEREETAGQMAARLRRMFSGSLAQ